MKKLFTLIILVFFITTLQAQSSPTNDNCSVATDLSSMETGTTLGATQSQPASTCNRFTGSADDDVWYQFTALTTGSVVVSLNADSAFDGVLEIFKGACGSLTSITCSDSSSEGGNEQITLDVIKGMNYKIRVYSFGKSMSNAGTFSISATGSAMPISLLYFKGEHVSNKNVLSWATASEINNQGFEIEYSFNGSDFRKLSFVNSKTGGNSNSNLNYQYTDSKAAGGNVYYRLMQVDKDGRLNYSNIILIKGEKINTLSLNAIYPNPAKNKLNLIVSSPVNNQINIRITNLAGKTVHQEAFSIINGGNNLDIDIAKLPAGSYFIKAICNNGCQTAVSKFVKE